MKIEKVLKIILIFAISIIVLTPKYLLATNNTETSALTVNIKNVNADINNIGEYVTVHISWTSPKNSTFNYEDVQAIGFTLKYDESKMEINTLEIEKRDETNASLTNYEKLEEDFYNVKEEGTLVVTPISLNDKGILGIEIKFKLTDKGDATIKLTDVDCVANGNLISPDVIDFNTDNAVTLQIIAFGDVNLDDEVNGKDSVYLAQYLEGEVELSAEQLKNADVNLDGVVDYVDVDLLTKSSAGWFGLPIWYGDVDLDGCVDGKDGVKLSQFFEGLIEGGLEKRALANADTNMDGVVNEIDLHVLTQYLAGWEHGMPSRMIKNSNLKAIDRNELHIVAGFNLEELTVNKILKHFNSDFGIEVYNGKNEKIENDSVVGTGTKVKVEEYNQGWVAEYNVVVYGDTTGDGKINAIDALALIKHLNNSIPFTNAAYKEAGSIVCKEGEEPTVVDALAIIKHANGKQTISQVK